jgi:hypothetical protein
MGGTAEQGSQRTGDPAQPVHRQRDEGRGRQLQRGRQDDARDVSLALRQRRPRWHGVGDVLVPANQRQLRVPEQQVAQRPAEGGTRVSR